jgi:cell division protein YceG involved in septum cleavage
MMIKKKNFRGQVTLFVIIGLVIVAIGILIYLLYPKIRGPLGFDEENPYQTIQTCLEDNVREVVEKLSLSGGSVEPEHYIVYNGDNIEYLCYTNEYYKTCVVQQPLLKRHIELEIQTQINERVRKCFLDLESNFKKKGYTVNLRTGGVEAELLPKRVVLNFNHSLTLTKEGSDNYDKFSVVVNNNLYELISIANSIIQWEARYGDAETTTYMTYYRDLKVEKKLQQEGTTIYILTDRNNENKFQFASRSVAWPPGY